MKQPNFLTRPLLLLQFALMCGLFFISLNPQVALAESCTKEHPCEAGENRDLKWSNKFVHLEEIN